MPWKSRYRVNSHHIRLRLKNNQRNRPPWSLTASAPFLGGLFCRLSAPAFKQKGWGFQSHINISIALDKPKKKIRFIEKLELLGYAKRSILLARCELRLRYSSPHKSWPEFPMPLTSQNISMPLIHLYKMPLRFAVIWLRAVFIQLIQIYTV